MSVSGYVDQFFQKRVGSLFNWRAGIFADLIGLDWLLKKMCKIFRVPSLLMIVFDINGNQNSKNSLDIP